MNEETQAAAESMPLHVDDREIQLALKRFHRLRWIAVGALTAVVVIALSVLATVVYYQQDEISTLRLQLTAGCAFFTDLSSLPVTPVPPAKRPSQLGVNIVVHSRGTAKSLSCPNLPPPDPSLKKWAAYYHVPVP